MLDLIKMCIAWIGTVFIYLIGGIDISLISLAIFMVLDYITGLIKGYKTGVLSSKTGIWGIVHKIGILILVMVVTTVDRLIADTGLLRTPVLYFLVANEGLSIIENLGACNIVIPESIKEKLEQLKEK